MKQLKAITRVGSGAWLGGWTLLESIIVFAIVALLAALIWGVCVEIHSHGVKQGIVIGKSHNAAWVQTTYITMSDGKGSTWMMPQTIYWPEDWIVTIAGTNASGEHLTRNLNVGESDYHAITNGEFITAN